MTEVVIAAIAAGLGSVITIVGKVIVDIIRAKKEPVPGEEKKKEDKGCPVTTPAMESKCLEITDSIQDLSNELNEKIAKVVDLVTELRSRDEEAREINKIELRHSITGIYYNYCDKKVITHNVKEDICSLYSAYKKLGGNSYVHEIYEEMMSWEVK